MIISQQQDGLARLLFPFYSLTKNFVDNLLGNSTLNMPQGIIKTLKKTERSRMIGWIAEPANFMLKKCVEYMLAVENETHVEGGLKTCS